MFVKYFTVYIHNIPLLFFLPNKELSFSSVGEPLPEHGHDPPPFNGPFFMTPPFSESQSCDPSPVSTPSPPLLISDKSLRIHFQ